MKLGVFSVLLGAKPLEDTLEYLSKSGVEMIELGCGGYPGTAHCNPEILLNDKKALDQFKKTLEKYNIEISALSCHGNAVHPNKTIAEEFEHAFQQTILLAEVLGVHQINTFSGCPGSCETSKYPNWVTCPWPHDFSDILDYQWETVLIPYWKKAVTFAKSHGVDKIALEMHPGFTVYNPEGLLRLREAVGPEIGANFDPSHLIWQGIDPCVAIRALKDCIFHFHAKDTRVDPQNVKLNGVLDTKSYSDIYGRSWSFRTVGYGHDDNYWKDMMSTLKLIGYNHAISIEHEDGIMSTNEGLQKAISFLKNVMIVENPSDMWWA